MMHDRPHRLNRTQFSLASLFCILSITAILFAVWRLLGGDLIREFAGLLYSCVFVSILILIGSFYGDSIARLPPIALMCVMPPLYALLTFCFFLFGEAIDQPHPDYARGSWMTVAMSQAVPVLPIVAFAILVVVAVDLMLHGRTAPDAAYYPRSHVFQRATATRQSQFTLIIGLLLILAYYASTVIDIWESKQLATSVWRPKRVFVACHFLWGLLWLVDCLSQIDRGTIIGAIGFLAFAVVVLLPFASTLVRG